MSLTRSQRVDNSLVGSTPADVGPGRYDAKDSIVVGRPSYAPFQSSSERQVNTGDACFFPGPGEYEKEKTYAYGSDRSSMFRSKVLRLAEERAQSVPGPGAYIRQVPWKVGEKTALQKIQDKTKTDEKNLQWVRVAAIPSIPGHKAFGYEETPLGDLVPQAAPYKIYSGSQTDSVGPGHYTVDPTTFDRGMKGTLWSKSRAHRAQLAVKVSKGEKPVPGPGRYDTQREPETYLKKKASANFASSSKRWKGFSENRLPGPGAYSAKSDFDKLQEYVPDQFQFFGSKGNRNLTHIDVKNPVPGPGTYDTPGAFKVAKKDDMEEIGPLPFSTTAVRFAESKLAAEPTPGPGTYSTMKNISYEMSKKVFSRNQSFGSTSKRFNKTLQKENAAGMLGSTLTSPFDQQLAKQQQQQEDQLKQQQQLQQRKPMGVFKSNSTRFNTKHIEKKAEGPAPGHYDADIGRQEREKMMDPRYVKQTFLSAQSRFDTAGDVKKALLNSHLGPGRYNAHSKKLAAALPHAPEVTSVFRSDQRRFVHNSQQSGIPGPGQYEIRKADAMVKRSFNITIQP